MKRGALSLSSHECFSCKVRGWKSFWCAFTLFNLTRHQTSTWLIYWCNIFLFWDRRDLSKSKENNIETNRAKTKKRFYEHNKGVALTRHTLIFDQEVGVKFCCARSRRLDSRDVVRAQNTFASCCLLPTFWQLVSSKHKFENTRGRQEEFYVVRNTLIATIGIRKPFCSKRGGCSRDRINWSNEELSPVVSSTITDESPSNLGSSQPHKSSVPWFPGILPFSSL